MSAKTYRYQVRGLMFPLDRSTPESRARKARAAKRAKDKAAREERRRRYAKGETE
jgi:hypothetical protein